MGIKKNDNKDKNKGKKVKMNDEDDLFKKDNKKNNKNEKKEKRHKQKNWQDSDEFVKHLKEFNEEVSKYNLNIRDVQGDGNCLFRSVSDQLEGDENIHMYYRKIAVEQMKKQSDFFKNFVFDVDFENYLNDMSQSSTWGGNLEIQALSVALGHNFVIHMKGRPYLVIKGKAIKGIKKKTLHLAYHTEDDGDEHYSSIRNIGDDDKTPAQQVKNEVFKLLEKQMNKEEGIEDTYEDENDDDIEVKDEYKSEESTNINKKGQKQSKIDVAKEKREKAKAKKLSKQDIKNCKQQEKTHKNKKKQINNDEIENDEDESDNDSQDSTSIEQNENQDNNIEQQIRLKKEIKQREEEQQFQNMIKQIQTLNITQSDKQEDQDEIYKKPSRNQKCNCGSLKAYKKCCESKDEAQKKMKKQQEQANQSSIKDVVFI